MILSIQNLNRKIYYLKCRKKKTSWYNCKTIIIFCFVIFFQLSMGSCKTCKCPAYSIISIQNSQNW